MSNLLAIGATAVTVVIYLTLPTNAFGSSTEGRRGEVAPLPLWDNTPPSRTIHRNKGDVGDIDPRGSVRYNFGHNGRVLRGVITKHREVPIDDIGTGLDQATEECCFPDSY